jgi:hypothetical protein
MRFVPCRRSRIAAPTVLVTTDEQGRVTIMPAPESQAFWQQCPWAGDDDESVRFRRLMEEHYG